MDSAVFDVHAASREKLRPNWCPDARIGVRHRAGTVLLCRRRWPQPIFHAARDQPQLPRDVMHQTMVDGFGSLEFTVLP
jgi:hypothetical protein